MGTLAEEQWIATYMPDGPPTDMTAPAEYGRHHATEKEFYEALREHGGQYHLEVDRFGAPVTLVDQERGEVLEYAPDYSWMDRPRPEPAQAKPAGKRRAERKPKILNAAGTPSIATIFKR